MLQSGVFNDGIFTVLQYLGSAATGRLPSGRGLSRTPSSDSSAAASPAAAPGGPDRFPGPAATGQARTACLGKQQGQLPDPRPVRLGDGARDTLVTTDRCDGTLVGVRRGSVEVRDFVRGRTVVVRAGKSYLARARR